MDGIVSRDFMDRPCNCNHASKINGKCAYNGECRKMCVVYKATCRVCDESYIGQTQQKLKDWIGQHLNDVKKLITKGIKSDSFASHFANHCKKETKPTNDELRRMMKVKIIWQGNAISCMKSFGKLNCSLCMRKRIKILRTICQEEWKIINTCNEIYGACQQKTRFHRFLNKHTNVKNTSTDEGNKPEKVYKYDDRAGTRWLRWFSGIVSSSRACFQRHPTSRCSWCLHADPSMCMIIVQRAGYHASAKPWVGGLSLKLESHFLLSLRCFNMLKCLDIWVS
jgi:hypothetical protein